MDVHTTDPQGSPIPAQDLTRDENSAPINPRDSINHGPISRKNSLEPYASIPPPNVTTSDYSGAKLANARLASIQNAEIPRSVPKVSIPNGKSGGTSLIVPSSASSRPVTPGPMRSSDTPLPSQPGSPRIHATTLNIPGLTKSKVSQDGKIPNRDLGSKLVIVMVGLPARGKSYITKKTIRYLNWLQYDAQIFNVGSKRRVAGTTPRPDTPPDVVQGAVNALNNLNVEDQPKVVRGTGLGVTNPLYPPKLSLDGDSSAEKSPVVDIFAQHFSKKKEEEEEMSQNADFFDPNNKKAAKIREKVALETLDELLHYIMYDGGAVGIFDATNSTLERRQTIVKHIRQKAGKELGILFIESVCEDKQVLESNIRLKLSGPDYKGKDPEASLADFRKRIEMYEKSYVPLGEYEEEQGWQFLRLIDVGRKFVCHGIRGFLANHTAYYLMNFNLHPRQIWITRHGESLDNVEGRIGGDASLSKKGDRFAEALAEFIGYQRKLFQTRLADKHSSQHFPPLPGDSSPPNPEARFNFAIGDGGENIPLSRNFCVWTSMLKRSIETGTYFNDDDYDKKEWRMLDELNAGIADGKTYEEIKRDLPNEYRARRADKLRYRYPGPGGESYLDVIHRLKDVIVEVERMADHVLLIGHRVIARVLLAYFMGLDRGSVADLDVPLGHVYILEPKPYGVDFKCYKYDGGSGQFQHLEDYQLLPADADRAERECMI